MGKLPQMTFHASPPKLMIILITAKSYQALTLMLRESRLASQPRIVFPSLRLAPPPPQANLCIPGRVGAFPSLVSKAVPEVTPPWPMVPQDGDLLPLEALVALQPRVGVPHLLQTP